MLLVVFVIQTGYYVLGYLLMLAVMTYDLNILLAVCLGLTVGVMSDLVSDTGVKGAADCE